MGDNDFMLAGDGWVQVTPCGEFPHAGAGVTQVIDRATCDRIAADFIGRKSDANFPGVLVDFDHFSLDTEKSSEAAGWISDLESRATGLWARVRWSDAGLAAVQGGRFRLMSPVFPPPSACEDLGGGKIRPRALVSVALTNEPNIRGGRPLANRQVMGNREKVIGGDVSLPANHANDANGMIENRDGTGKKYRWVLGNPPSGEHCGECLARAGKVKTAREWAAMKAPPCNCHCSLEEVGADAANRWSVAARNRVATEALRRLANVGWTHEARAASLEVRRAKSAARDGADAGGAVRGIFAPPDRGTPVDPAKHGYNVPPDTLPPATDGTLVTAGDGVSLMVSGKLVRLGSAKVLSVGPDGHLLLKVGSKSFDLGKPDAFGRFEGARLPGGGFVSVGLTGYVRIGGCLVSLEDGSVRKEPATLKKDRRGVRIQELLPFV